MAYVIDDDENRTQEILARLEELEIQTFSSQVVGRNESTRNTGIESGDVAAVNPYPQWIPIRDYGTLGNLTLLVDQERVDGHIAKMTINGDVDFAFEFPPPAPIFDVQLGKMMQFIVDATIDAVGGYTINLPASVVPAGIEIDNAANARTVLRFTTTDGGTTYLAETLGSGSSTIPIGTAPFQHLEWNGTEWVNQQQLAFGTLHADSGQLQFTNDQIGLAWRDSNNIGNLEMKVTDTNLFDLTYDQQDSIGLQIRSQHNSDDDNILAFSIGTGTTAQALIETSTSLLGIAAAGFTRLFLDADPNTQLDLQSPTGQALFNIISDKTGTPNSLGLTIGTGASSPALIESSTAFLNIGAGGVSRLFLDVSTITKLNLESPDNVVATANFNIISKHDVNSDNVLGFTIGSGTGAIGLIDNSTPNLNIATGGLTRIVVLPDGIEMQDNNITRLNALAFEDSGGQIAGSLSLPEMNFVLLGNSTFRFTTDSEDILDISNVGLTILGTNNILLGNNNITGINQLAFNESGQTITDSISGIIYSVPDTQDTHTFVIDGNPTVTMEKFFFDLSNTRIQMTQEVDPTSNPNAGDIFVYAKLDGGIAALFYMQSNGTIVGPLGGNGGGGPPFDDNIPLVQDNLDNTRLFQIDAGSIFAGTTSVLGTVTLTAGRTWFLPDATTTIAGLAVTQTFTGINNFSSTAIFDATSPAINVTSGPINLNNNNIENIDVLEFSGGSEISDNNAGDLLLECSDSTDKITLAVDIGSPISFEVEDLSSVFTATLTDNTTGLDMVLDLRDATPVDFQEVGRYVFQGRNAGNSPVEYAVLRGQIIETSSSTVTGKFAVDLESGGGDQQDEFIVQGVTPPRSPGNGPDYGFNNTVGQANPYTSNTSLERTVTSSSSTSDVRDALGTLIADLKDKGILR